MSLRKLQPPRSDDASLLATAMVLRAFQSRLEALMRLADHRCSEAEQLAHEEAEDGVREAGG